MAEHEPAIERAWRRKGLGGRLLFVALRPLSLVFSLIARSRAAAYRILFFRRKRVRAAVVSVGNLSVGGTGKTPTALWLAERLQGRGYKVALVSRGYGGDAKRPTLVGKPPAGIDDIAASEDVAVVGDENLMLARRFSGPVLASKNRVAAARLAAKHGADVIVLDDGFQHLALRRDFDLVCHRLGVPGDDVVLPAGRLREPLSALRRANAVVITKTEGDLPLPPSVKGHLRSAPVYRGELRAVALVTPDPGGLREVPMGFLSSRRALGVAGLADPDPFYRTLHDWETRLEDFLEFPDHHVYTLEDWKKIAHRSRELDLVVTTEKDLVKLDKFPFAKDKLVALRVAMEIEGGDALVDSVAEAIERRRAEIAGGSPA